MTSAPAAIVSGTTRSSLPLRTATVCAPGASVSVSGVAPRRTPSMSTSEATAPVLIVRLPTCGLAEVQLGQREAANRDDGKTGDDEEDGHDQYRSHDSRLAEDGAIDVRVVLPHPRSAGAPSGNPLQIGMPAAHWRWGPGPSLRAASDRRVPTSGRTMAACRALLLRRPAALFGPDAADSRRARNVDCMV